MGRAGLYVIIVLALLFLALPPIFLVEPNLFSFPGGGAANYNVSFTIYAGEISTSTYGFGLSSGNLTSPGPTLSFKVNDVVKITYTNAGKIPHAFAITDAAKTGANVLFGATIASSSAPLSPGGSGTVIFTASTAGSYYYICPVPGHAELGMWGRVNVTQ